MHPENRNSETGYMNNTTISDMIVLPFIQSELCSFQENQCYHKITLAIVRNSMQSISNLTKLLT